MPIYVVDQDTDLKALRSRLLSGRLSDERADLALRALQDLNPHVDFKRLAIGDVLLVPDSPGFKTSASKSAADDVVDDLQELVRRGLDAAAARFKAGNEARAAERAEVTRALKSRALVRVLEADPELKAQLLEVTKGFKEEHRQAVEDERTLEAATENAMAELASLTKLLR
jgi:hypothetical protein